MDYLLANWQVVIFFWFWFGAISAYIAAGKSRNVYAWFLLGFIFPVLGIIAALVVGPPTRKVDEQGRAAAVALGESADYRKCPFCAEAIRKEAVKCRYCQSDVPPLEAQAL